MKSVMEKGSKTTLNFDRVIEKNHQWLAEFIKGNNMPLKEMFSHKDDATLANPFGSVARGWRDISQTMDRSALHYRDGEMADTETKSVYVTPELTFLVEIVRFNARIGSRNDMTPVALRITTVLRPEDGAWKIMHLHADPLVSHQQAESIIQK